MSVMINCLIFLSVIALLFLPALTISSHNITAVFAFGDGFYDSGNNNNLPNPSPCIANLKPYGIHFPHNIPTGRFSDGELPGDFVVKSLGLKKFLRSFADIGVGDEEVLTGVSFASACSGISGATALESLVISLPMQFGMYRMTLNRIKMAVGKERAAKITQGALYLISTGTYDFLKNVYTFVPKPGRNKYIVDLQEKLEVHIKELYSMGAMKFAVSGLPPIGCMPLDKMKNGKLFKRTCVEEHNRDVEAYNEMLHHRLHDLEHNLPGARIIYIDIYRPLLDMVINPDKFNMVVAHKGCCGTGWWEVGKSCTLTGSMCLAPSGYVFWDAVHPTEKAYKVMMKRFLDKELHSLLV